MPLLIKILGIRHFSVPATRRSPKQFSGPLAFVHEIFIDFPWLYQLSKDHKRWGKFLCSRPIQPSTLLLQEDAAREDASRILLLKEMNDKAKSISILLLVSRDFVYVLFWNWRPEKCTFEGCSAKRKRREKKQTIVWAHLKAVEMRRHKLFLRRWSAFEQLFRREKIGEYWCS